MNGLLLLVRLILSATFAVAGVTKLTDAGGTRQSILDFGAPAFLARPIAFLLPLAELACAIALLPAGMAAWGAAGTLALLLLFIFVISMNLMRGRRPKCHCFGQLHSEPVGWTTLARNVVLAGMAGLVIAEARTADSPGYAGWFASLSQFETAVLAFSLALAGLAALWVWSVIHLLRQNGRLMVRLDAVEAQLGLQPAPPEPGLPLRTPAPAFSLSALDGSIVTLDMLRREHDAVLLIFTELGCGGCDALMPKVAEWQKEYADRLSVVLIGSGDLAKNRAKAAEHGLRNYLLQVNEATAKAYQAEGTPVAVFIRKGKITSAVASGADAIEELMAKATEPPPLDLGDAAPDLSLPDLDGETLNLRSIRGQRRLVVFWNPDCGFCQDMTAELKAWERERTEEAPQLVLVSTGDPEANRAQGFRARILLDFNFRLGQMFGASGTPSAVILDEEGRVASEVGVGKVEVLALAGTRVGSAQPV